MKFCPEWIKYFPIPEQLHPLKFGFLPALRGLGTRLAKKVDPVIVPKRERHLIAAQISAVGGIPPKTKKQMMSRMQEHECNASDAKIRGGSH